MGSNKSRAKTIGAAILATAALTAAATTMVFSLRTAPPPVETPRSIVYVPVVLPGSAADDAVNASAPQPVGRTQVTSAELAGPSGSDTPESPDSEQATEAPEGASYSLSDVLEGARAKLEALGAAALSSTPAPVETPAVLAEAAPAPAPEAPAPQPEAVAQRDVAPEPPPVVGAGAFTTPPPYGASAWQSPPNAGAGAFTTPAPYAASAWKSDPNAGAGQFSTDKGSIDPGVGAGPFTTEWHIPPSVVLVYPY